MAGTPENDPFDALVKREGDGLFRYLYWSLHDREEALDALQDTLVRAFRGFGGLRDPTKAKAWLYQIAKNVARRTQTKRRRRPTLLGSAPAEDARTSVERTLLAPGAQLEALETNAKLAAALESLEPELREPLLLFALSGLKYREIADALGWPMGTVTNRIHVAREKVAEILRGSGPPQ